MYELLFRSRWYAFAWAMCMAVSALVFTTTGLGAWLTGTRPEAHSNEEAREHQFRNWAEDDKRRLGDEQGYDPSSPELVRDGDSRREDRRDPQYRSAPFAADDQNDAETADIDDGASKDGASKDGGNKDGGDTAAQ